MTGISILVGLIYSTSNIINYYYSKDNNDFSFIPIGSWDELFYHSYSRELLDGTVFSGDSQIREYKSKLSLHTTYGISYLITGISSLMTGDIISGFYINRFILPVINFILFFIFINYLTKNYRFSILCSLLIIFFYDYFSLSFPYINIGKIDLILKNSLGFKSLNYGFYRIPNIAFTNIISLLSLIYYYKYMKSHQIKYYILIVVIFILSAYTYLVTFFISGCIYIVSTLYSIKYRLIKPIPFFVITVPLYLLMFPIIYLFYDIMANNPPYYSQINETLIGFYGGSLRGNIYDILRFHFSYNLLGITILHLFDTSPHRKINTSFFFLVILIFFLCLLLLGANYYERFNLRGILPIFLPIMFSNIYFIFKNIFNEKVIYIRIFNSKIIQLSIFPFKYFNNIVFKLISFVQNRKYIIGIFFILFGIVSNEIFIGKLFTNDGTIDILSNRIYILLFDIFCVIFGLTIIFYENIFGFFISKSFTYYKFTKTTIIMFFILFTIITASVYNIQTTLLTRDQWYNDRRDLKVFFKMLNNYTKKNDIIMTLDPEIQYRIPTYTHLNIYNPNVLISGFMGRFERVNRLYDSMKFFSIKSEPFSFLLKNRYESPYAYTKEIDSKSINYFPFQFWMSNYYFYPNIHEDINSIVDIELAAYENHNYDKDFLINRIDYFLTSNFTSNIYRDYPTSNTIDYSMYKILFSYKEFTVYLTK